MAASGDLDLAWTPPVAIRSWRREFPFELLRYAAANRLRVELDPPDEPDVVPRFRVAL